VNGLKRDEAKESHPVEWPSFLSVAVAKRLGHSGTDTLDHVYGHSGREDDERAADEIATARRASIRLA
jgi:hypothetical protein